VYVEEQMKDNKNTMPAGSAFMKPWLIAVIAVIIMWIIGKGILTLISSVKHM